jgi:outer membrane protein
MKKVNFKKIILSLVLIMLSTFAIAQENVWTFQKCVDLAIKNNIELKIRQIEVKRVQKSRNSVWNGLLPTVSFNGNHSYNFGSTIDPSTNGRVSSNIQNDNFFINANFNILDFSAIANAQKNKIEIEKAKANKEIIENEYRLQLLESYYQALFSQELLNIQKEQFKNAIFNLDRISKEVNLGKKPKSDLYDIQLSFAQEEKRILETEQLYLTQKTQLFQLMNATEVEVAMVILVASKENIETTVQTEASNPKIKFAKLNYESSLKELKFQRAASLPSLSTFYNISSFYYKPLNQPNTRVDNFSNQIGDNKNQQVGLQLIVPIFNGFRNSKRSNAAKLESEKSKLIIDQERQKINNQIALENQNKRNFKVLQSKINETLLFAKASFGTTQNKFLAGKVDAILLSSVKNQLLTLEYDVLKNSLQLEYTNLKMKLLAQN